MKRLIKAFIFTCTLLASHAAHTWTINTQRLSITLEMAHNETKTVFHCKQTGLGLRYSLHKWVIIRQDVNYFESTAEMDRVVQTVDHLSEVTLINPHTQTLQLGTIKYKVPVEGFESQFAQFQTLCESL